MKRQTANVKHQAFNIRWWVAALILITLTACVSKTRSAEQKLSDLFPADGAIAGWTKSGGLEVYNHETLYDLVDGQADAFFAYGFEQVAVQSYQSESGDMVRVHLWQLKTPADAYGLFTFNMTGEPVQVGNGGDADPDRRIAFWQDRYFAQLFAFRPVDHTVLTALAVQLSNALPRGGERPALVDRLPPDSTYTLFFHEEISIMSHLWLGGENLLALSQETQGALGRYQIEDKPVYLMLIEYPTVEAAEAGLQALLGGQIEEVVAADRKDRLVGAVFGQIEADRAWSLLRQAK